MDKFETQFSDLDVQTSYMEQTMSQSTATTTPQDQVDALINQVADEAGLERQHELGSKGKVPEGKVQAEEKEAERPVGEEDARLAERLRALRVSGCTCALLDVADKLYLSPLRDGGNTLGNAVVSRYGTYSGVNRRCRQASRDVFLISDFEMSV